MKISSQLNQLNSQKLQSMKQELIESQQQNSGLKDEKFRLEGKQDELCQEVLSLKKKVKDSEGAQENARKAQEENRKLRGTVDELLSGQASRDDLIEKLKKLIEKNEEALKKEHEQFERKVETLSNEERKIHGENSSLKAQNRELEARLEQLGKQIAEITEELNRQKKLVAQDKPRKEVEFSNQLLRPVPARTASAQKKEFSVEKKDLSKEPRKDERVFQNKYLVPTKPRILSGSSQPRQHKLSDPKIPFQPMKSNKAQALDQLYFDCLERSKNILERNMDLLNKTPVDAKSPQSEANLQQDRSLDTSHHLKTQKDSSRDAKTPTSPFTPQKLTKVPYIHNQAKQPEKLAKYTGDTLGQMRHGRGKQLYDDGTTYEGEWFKDQRYGYGTLKSNEGEIYLGKHFDESKL